MEVYVGEGIKGEINIRSYGLYIIKDNFSLGRVSGFMPYPSDISAAYGFKMFVDNKEQMKMFPFPRKLELVRVCEIDQLTDRVVTTVFDRTICNAATIDNYIENAMKNYKEE